MFVLSTVFLTIVYFPKKRIYQIYKETMTHFKFLFLGGITNFLAALSIFLALNLTITVYAVSIRRTSILFTIIFGFAFFKEKDLIKNLIAGIIMLFGIILIAVG